MRMRRRCAEREMLRILEPSLRGGHWIKVQSERVPIVVKMSGKSDVRRRRNESDHPNCFPGRRSRRSSLDEALTDVRSGPKAGRAAACVDLSYREQQLIHINE